MTADREEFYRNFKIMTPERQSDAAKIKRMVEDGEPISTIAVRMRLGQQTVRRYMRHLRFTLVYLTDEEARAVQEMRKALR